MRKADKGLRGNPTPPGTKKDNSGPARVCGCTSVLLLMEFYFHIHLRITMARNRHFLTRWRFVKEKYSSPREEGNEFEIRDERDINDRKRMCRVSLNAPLSIRGNHV